MTDQGTQIPPLHFPDTHLLLLAQAAPRPPQVFVGPQVVLSVQSVVVRHAPPSPFSKQLPPLHFPDRHWLSAVHVTPGHEARQVPALLGVPEQLPLRHWALAVQGVVAPYGITHRPL